MKDLPTILSGLTLIGILWGFRDKIFKSGISEQQTKDKVIELEKRDKETEGKIIELGKDIKKIKENHLVHIQGDLTDIKISIARIEERLKN